MMSYQNQDPRPQAGLSTNESKIFKRPDHADNISTGLLRFYEKKELFDIVLVAGVDNVELPAHRIVLSLSSDFFLGMFSNPVQEATSDKVQLKEIDGITLRKIIDFMYTSEIELNCETVESVLIAADFLQMNALIDGCCNFMGEQLNASNCLGFALFAEQRNYKKLLDEAYSFALTRFDHVYAEMEFVQLNEKQLSKYLSSDDLLPTSEENVFESVVAWVAYDRENREKCIFNLLSCIRFTLLKPKFIIENRHSVCKTIECYELICSWLEWHLSPKSCSLSTKQNTKVEARKQKLVVVSGPTDDLKIHTLNRELNTWSVEKLVYPSKQRFEYAELIINKKMIFAGGYVDGDFTNSVICLDLETKEWIDLPPMSIARCCAAMAELNGELYVVGGRTHNMRWSRSVEKYNFNTQEWQVVPSLNIELTLIKVAVGDGILYASGDNFPVVEYYDLAANKWRLIDNKNEKSEAFAIATVDGYLYTVGGYDADGERSQTVERYHHSTDTWSFVMSVKELRRCPVCITLNNRLITCGVVHSNENCVLSIEEYNPGHNYWLSLTPLQIESPILRFKIHTM